MIKVANIIEEGRVGGPQRRIILVASACANKVETTVILPHEDSQNLIKLCKENGVKYKLVKFSSARKDFMNVAKYLVYYVPEVVGLWYHLKNKEYDLVHVSGGSWQSKGILAAKLARIPVVWHLNDSAMPKIIRFVFSIFSVIPVGFIFSSYRTKEYYVPYIRGTHDHEIILPAPVDTAAYGQLALSDYRNLKNQFKGKLILGTWANINPIKGIESVIDVAKRLKKHERQIEFVICGAVHQNQIPYYDSLILQCRRNDIKNVSFLGFTDKPGLLMSEIDIYLCSSLAESSPTAVWEAMALAKPIVSFDVGDVSYQLNKANAGHVAPCGDIDALVHGLERYIHNPKLRRIDGGKLQKSSLKELDVKIIASTYAAFCRSVVSVSHVID